MVLNYVSCPGSMITVGAELSPCDLWFWAYDTKIREQNTIKLKIIVKDVMRWSFRNLNFKGIHS